VTAKSSTTSFRSLGTDRANVVCFLAGGGSVFDLKPVSRIKFANNSDTYRRLSEDMDINCANILDGATNLEDAGREIFELMSAVASGQRTKSEDLGLGNEEFESWQLRAML